MVIQNDDKENEDKAIGLDFLKSDWDKYPHRSFHLVLFSRANPVAVFVPFSFRIIGLGFF